jgi:hypothetical protein
MSSQIEVDRRNTPTHEISPVDNVLYFPNNIDVRICPKNGMSSLKEAYRRLHGNHVADDGLVYGNYVDRYTNVRKYGYTSDLPFRKNSFRIAVRRDPIDRFKSACKFILQERAYFIRHGRANDLPEISEVLDDVIDSVYNSTIKNNHFYTQTWYMGKPEDYDMVVHISELNKALAFIEEATGRKSGSLSNLHENKTTLKLHNDAISAEQLQKLYDLYAKDFKNGWCKQEDIITV